MMLKTDVGGRTALVTGGASGIGLAAVESFARGGAKVALNHLPDDTRGPREVARLGMISAPGSVSVPGEAEKMVTVAVDGLASTRPSGFPSWPHST